MSKISNYIKICPVGAKQMNVDRQRAGHNKTHWCCSCLMRMHLKTMTNDIKMHTLWQQKQQLSTWSYKKGEEGLTYNSPNNNNKFWW